MPTIQISSPATGSSVPANTNFAVSVQWDATVALDDHRKQRKKDKKEKKALLVQHYIVRCDGQDFLTDDAINLKSFDVMAGAAGTTKTVTVTLLDNSTMPPSALASDSVTVNVMAAAGLPGTIGARIHAIAGKKGKAAAPAVKYVCGTLTAAVQHLIVVTFQVKVDVAFPRDGVPGSPMFTVSKRLKKVTQYSANDGTLTIDLAAGKWQATVQADITGAADGYQIEVWFLDAAWAVLATGRTALAPIAQATACP